MLDAYSHRNPAVGYCQAMNFIGATLLLFLQEADAFWCLCAIVELVLPEGLYAPRLRGVATEMRLLSDLLARGQGALLAHLERHGVSLEVVCAKWIMCCFVTVLPLPSALRLWDLMLLDAASGKKRDGVGDAGCSAVPLIASLYMLRRGERKLRAAQGTEELLPAIVSLSEHLTGGPSI